MTKKSSKAQLILIAGPEVVFISGGDQAIYSRGWKGTPVDKAVNDGIAAGKPIGETSAGLAVEGEFVCGALGDKPDDQNLFEADGKATVVGTARVRIF